MSYVVGDDVVSSPKTAEEKAAREKFLEEALQASRQMDADNEWPVTGEELVKYHNSSFEFGFACGALWSRKETIQKALSWFNNYFKGYNGSLIYLDDFLKFMKEENGNNKVSM